MKVAFFVGKFPKLSQTFIINQVVELVEQGCDVTVFAQNRPTEKVTHDIIDKYDLIGRTIYAEPPERYSQAAWRTTTAVHKLAQNHPKKFKEVLKTVPTSSKYEIGRWFAMLKTFLEHDEDYDIHHAHFGTRAKEWGFVPILDDTPFVVTCYGYDVSKFVHPNKYDWYQGFWHHCDAVIGITHHILTKAMLLGCPEEITSKIPIGVDTDQFDGTPTPYDGDTVFRVASVARCVEKKGLKYGIDAVADGIKQGIDMEYKIAGDGELRDQLETQIEDRGVGDQISILGWKTQSEVKELLEWSHVVMQPSVTAVSGDMEGQLLVLQEAQATGTPVISTYHNGIPEGVLEKETGILVPERDTSALTAGLKTFAKNPNRIENYGHQAAEYVNKNFDCTDLTSVQMAFYFELSDR